VVEDDTQRIQGDHIMEEVNSEVVNNEVVTSNKRKAKKEYVILPVPMYGFLQIKLTAGGKVPDALSGFYTNKQLATMAIRGHNKLTGKNVLIAD